MPAPNCRSGGSLYTGRHRVRSAGSPAKRGMNLPFCPIGVNHHSIGTGSAPEQSAP